MDYDKTEMARSYHLGRGYTRAQLNRWLAVISRWVPHGSLSTILDLGCGTGRYSGALAEHFRAQVIGVDPSEKMLAKARTKTAGGVRYVRACAESLPLIQGSVDMVFISMGFHHFDDPIRAVHECHRVLRAGATVCLRAATTEQIDRYAYVPFFAESRATLRRSLNPRRFIEAGAADDDDLHGLRTLVDEWRPFNGFECKWGQRASIMQNLGLYGRSLFQWHR